MRLEASAGAVTHFADPDVCGFACYLTLAEIDDQLQHFRIGLENAVIVCAVEVFYVSAEAQLAFIIFIEGSQYAALNAREAELIASKAIELALFTASFQVVFVILDHRANDVTISRQLGWSKHADQQSLGYLFFIFVIS